ncbi:autotransporter outer membrane beta-barrel domain-containing protein [Roseateles sp. SL47]|uniref:autotransporter domain-containing protein n=1 Tax=Roseateles sp. SL47 TaxID=2995138 RepID=UPI00227167AE|nr:autotransporter outer membrane beta-barrel domain-containing protein [Roseateles sp. SL47]WAC73068.1 autotransporter outer membrane beta-barrel domain-containing protein [Roseateles sp. SL47]
MNTDPLLTDPATRSRRAGRKRSPRKTEAVAPHRARLLPVGAQPVLAASLVVEVSGRGHGDQPATGWVMLRFSLARCLVLTGALEGDAREVALRSGVKQVSASLTRRVRWVLRRLNGGLLTLTALSVRGGHPLYRSLPMPEDRFKAMMRPGCVSSGPLEQVINESVFYGRSPAELHALFQRDMTRRSAPVSREMPPAIGRRVSAVRNSRPMTVRASASRGQRPLRARELRRSAISLSVCAAIATTAPVHYASAAAYASTVTRSGPTDGVFAPSTDAEGRLVYTLQRSDKLFSSSGPWPKLPGVTLNGATLPVIPHAASQSGALQNDRGRIGLNGQETRSNRASHWAMTDTDGQTPAESGASEGLSPDSLVLSGSPATAAADASPAEVVLTAGEALDAMRNLVLRTSNWTAGNVSNSASRTDEAARHVWATPMASHDRTHTSGGRQYRQNVTAVNVGGDWQVGQVGNGTVRAGVSLTQGHVEDAYARGNGMANLTSVNGHVSVRTKTGAYLAGSVGAASVRAVYDASSLEQSVSSGKFRMSAATASLEGGKPFELARGLTLEPSASVVGAVLFKDSDVTTAGVLIETRRTSFGQAKAGLTLRHMGTNDTLTHQVYVRASALKGFGTNPSVHASKDGDVIGTQAVVGRHAGHEEALGASIGLGRRKALALSLEAGHQKISGSTSGWSGMVNVSFRW